MQERPDVTLPLARSCPFAPPDGYDRVRETPGLATAELPGGALTWLVTRLGEARAALAAPEFSTDRSDPAFPLPQQRPRPADPRPRPPLTPEERRARSRGASLIGMDPPDHTTARRAVIGEFTARRVQACGRGSSRSWTSGSTRCWPPGRPPTWSNCWRCRSRPRSSASCWASPTTGTSSSSPAARRCSPTGSRPTSASRPWATCSGSWTSWSAPRRRNRAATCSAGRSRPGARRATTTTGTWSAWPSCCWWPGTRRPRA